MPETETETTSYYVISPKNVPCPLSLEEAFLAAGDLEFYEMVLLFTAYVFLVQTDRASEASDICARFDVDETTMAPFVTDKMPTHSWWQCMVSRASEAQTPKMKELERGDWSAIGTAVLGFARLHRGAEDYPVSIPTMMGIYTQVGLVQTPESTLKVRDDDIEGFNADMEGLWAALHRRMTAFGMISNDSVCNAPIIKLFGDAGIMSKWLLDQSQGGEA